MIRVVIRNLTPVRPHRFIFLCLREHLDSYELEKLLLDWAPGCVVVPVDRVTEGAACTVLLAEYLINNDQPLMIANCDQWVDINIDSYLKMLEDSSAEGLIMTMKASDPKWSFVRIAEDGGVTEVVEKVVVSDEATVGIYNFQRGRDYVSAAHSMINSNLRVNGEFYVAPVYNELLKAGGKVLIYNVGTVGQGMHGLGTPADLEGFVQTAVSIKASSQMPARVDPLA